MHKAVDKVRKREVKLHEDLRCTKWLFLKDTASFTDEQYFKFEAIRGANYEVSRAWLIKENFRDILKRNTPENALTLFYMWKQNAKHANIKEIDEVVELFERHEKGIINAIKNQRKQRKN